MAGSVNKVILVGNLGKDPDVRTTQNGQKIVNFPLATSVSWNDRNTGERREKTEWHRIVIFNERVGDVAERFLKKGRKAYIEGTLRTRKWTDQSGMDRYTTEVVIERFRGELVLLDGRNSDEQMSSGPTGGGSNSSAPSAQQGSGWEEDAGASEAPPLKDDEIPF